VLPDREVDYLRQSSAEVKNEWSYISTLPTSSWHGTQLSTGTHNYAQRHTTRFSL